MNLEYEFDILFFEFGFRNQILNIHFRFRITFFILRKIDADFENYEWITIEEDNRWCKYERNIEEELIFLRMLNVCSILITKYFIKSTRWKLRTNTIINKLM